MYTPTASHSEANRLPEYIMDHLTFQGHARSVNLVDFGFVHLLSLKGAEGPFLILCGALGLGT